MYFHIDESGNTGNDLFNPDQPKLSYGVISSRTNVDALGIELHRSMLRRTGKTELHAKNLREDGILSIANELLALQEKMSFDFDFYFIEKPTLAAVVLFDAIFDAGINPAVKWESYWTPMRFMIIHKLAYLMDEQLLRTAWDLCTDRKAKDREGDIVDLLRTIRDRALATDWDSRSKEVIVDAVSFGLKFPGALDFGQPDKKLVSPNAVGFQFVGSSMARRLRAKKLNDAASIVVDKQLQFNKAQIETHRVQSLMAESWKKASPREKALYLNHPLYRHMAEDELFNVSIPKREVRICDSASSIGLQIVDIYLWIAQRMGNGNLHPKLVNLSRKIFRRSLMDGISMTGMERRFEHFMSTLPPIDEMTDEQLRYGVESVVRHRAAVRDLELDSP
jgi:hypothetical protein